VSKRFRTCDLNQVFLLPPSLQDWLPENHLARFVAEVTNELDLSKIVAVYGRKDGRGMAAYHPAMMVRMLLYGYCRGVVSSRKIERANATSAVSTGAESPAAAEPKNQQVGESTGQPAAKSAAETMREKLRTTAGQAVYKMRKAVVEPVFGQIKERRGLRGFLMRGREKVAAEWQIICLTHNLLKLFQARTAPASQAKSARTPSKSGELAYARPNCGLFAWICTLYSKARRWSCSESDVANSSLSFIPTDSSSQP
jgi:Transposase DDE domain/Transposase domain (DUF772)